MDRETKIVIAKRAKELLEAGWIKNSFFRDEKGVSCSVDDPTAVNFCFLGGFQRAYYEETGEKGGVNIAVALYKQELLNCIPKSYVRNGTVANWNDRESRTKRDVIKAVDCILGQLEGDCNGPRNED